MFSLLIASTFVLTQATAFSEKGNAFLKPYLSNVSEPLTLEGYEIVNVPGQGSFYIDPIDDWIKNCLRHKLIWEEEILNLLKFYIRPGTTVLDVGAHIGTHSVTMSKAVGSGQVLAFEPNKKIYSELCANLALNQAQNVIPLRCALGKESGFVKMILSSPKNEGGTYAIATSQGENLVPKIPLDDLHLTNVSFIKIDVENMEEEVLEGAKETIKRERPVMLIEIQGNDERASQLGENMAQKTDATIKTLEKMGYRLCLVGGRGRDYLALPK